MPSVIALLGSTGLVGSHALRALLQDDRTQQVLAIVRRPLPLVHPKLVALVTPLQSPSEELPALLSGRRLDAALCAVGTIRAQVADLAEYRRIDVDLPICFAEVCRQAGASHFGLISAKGSQSRLGYYMKFKAEVEDRVASLGFASLSIHKPGLLKGDRTQHRAGEASAVRMSGFLDALMQGPLREYRSIEES